MRLERLQAQFVEDFDCGQPSLNNWLKRQAKQSMRGRSAVVYLGYIGDELVGYFSLSNSGVLRDDAPVRIRAGQPPMIPLVLLGRLAVDTKFQGQRIGSALFGFALQICIEVAALSGVVAIRVDALNAESERFWRALASFESHPTAPNRLFLPLKGVVRTLL